MGKTKATRHRLSDMQVTLALAELRNIVKCENINTTGPAT